MNKQVSRIKKEIEEKRDQINKMKSLIESQEVSSISKLLENDLEQAKLILAAKDVLDKLQKIAEHLAELGAEEIMPLSDSMKGAFGPEVANDFEHTANDEIQKALETVRSAKDAINTAVLRVEGKLPSNDMSSDDGTLDSPQDDLGSSDVPSNQDMDSSDIDSDDGFGDSDLDVQDPMGRMKKESISTTQSILENYGRELLKTEKMEDLLAWLYEDVARILPKDKLKSYAENAVVKAAKTPEKTAGWIGKKKYGIAALAQMTKPNISNSASETLDITMENKESKLARDIALVIETNIKVFKAGNAAKVIEQVLSNNGLMEDSSLKDKVMEQFKTIFGMSPAKYSLELRKSLSEAGSTLPVPPTPPKPPAVPGTSKLNPQQKQKANSAVAKLASQVANNPSAGGDSVDNAIQGMDTQDQQAIRDLKDTISSNNGGEPTNVDDLLKDSGKVLDEAGPGGLEMPQGKKGKPFQTDAGLNKAKTGTPKGTSKKSPTKMSIGSKKPLAQESVDIEENINAALWPTDPKTGQYKGEPMSTDYGRLKPKTTKTDNTSVKTSKEEPTEKEPKEDIDSEIDNKGDEE